MAVSGGSFTAATQAEQEAGTDVTVGTTPGRQHFHPSAVKCWGKFTANSTTIEASYNITSVADTATGRMTVTIATDFSGADWAAFANAEVATFTTTTAIVTLDSAPTAGTCVIEACDVANNAFDAVAWFFGGLGDLA